VTKQSSHKLTASIIVLLAFAVTSCGDTNVVTSDKHHFNVETVVTGLSHPWSLAFLPDGDLLITERTGDLRRVSNGELLPEPISGLPKIRQVGQGGLLDVALHPDFQDNRLVYLSYAAAGDGGTNTEVLRGRLQNNALTDIEVIFTAQPRLRGGRHFGSRLLFVDDYLYISLGERGVQDEAQHLNNHLGTLVRLYHDGRVPEDNPFVDDPDALPGIYTYGNRNIQGLVLQPGTDRIWMHEHGPQGGDEVNIVKRGANYGWPVVTHGVEYITGAKIGVGTHKEGMEPPLHVWVPSIAPSGMTFYNGGVFPEWRGDLFVGSLRFGTLSRLEVEGEKVVHEERLLEGQLTRVRDVRQGPDGYLYLLTDERNGKLLRLVPAN
jgi:aldose sugar dehydrogenase